MLCNHFVLITIYIYISVSPSLPPSLSLSLSVYIYNHAVSAYCCGNAAQGSLLGYCHAREKESTPPTPVPPSATSKKNSTQSHFYPIHSSSTLVPPSPIRFPQQFHPRLIPSSSPPIPVPPSSNRMNQPHQLCASPGTPQWNHFTSAETPMHMSLESQAYGFDTLQSHVCFAKASYTLVATIPCATRCRDKDNALPWAQQRSCSRANHNEKASLSDHNYKVPRLKAIHHDTCTVCFII